MSLSTTPITYADFSTKPTVQASAEAGAAPLRYRTTVRIYLTHTGDDPGSTAEIKSQIYFDDSNSRLGSGEYSVKTDFGTNNSGLGILLVQLSKDSLAAPANFNATAYEEGGFGSGNRYFVQRPMDFGRTPEYMAPGVWTWKQWNSSDSGYVGTVQWEVVQL